jgi:RHS repeat-associated protein
MSRGKNCLWGLLRECTIKYDPMGNRIWREAVVKGAATGRKYIVDISGGLPIILCEIEDPNSFNPGSLKKSYYYADGQILSQRVHDPVAPNFYTPYFYVHDRLGSVRMVVDDTGAAVCSYTYRPYGAFYDGECVETSGVDNPWTFTGQYYDAEIEQYYLRARQYDPAMMRFTSRDPVRGKYQEPLTLHKYLYSMNDPMDRIDPDGKMAVIAARLISGAVGAAIAGGVAYATGQDRIAIGAAIMSGFIGGFSLNMWVSAGMGGLSAGFTTWMEGGGAREILQNASLSFAIGFAGGVSAGRISVGLKLDKIGEHSCGALGANLFSRGYSGVIQFVRQALGGYTKQDVNEIEEAINNFEEATQSPNR